MGKLGWFMSKHTPQYPHHVKVNPRGQMKLNQRESHELDYMRCFIESGKSPTELYEMLYRIGKVTNWIIKDALLNQESHQPNYMRCFVESEKSQTGLCQMLDYIRRFIQSEKAHTESYQTFYWIRKVTNWIISDVLLNKESHKLDYIRRRKLDYIRRFVE